LDVKLSEGDRETFAQILSRHHGQVVLVDFWATWCGPCVKQFPHTVELSHKYRDQGLAVVTVSMNEPKERDSVLAFLTRQKADVENLLPKYGAGSEFLEAFDLRGDVPFYKLYDKQGVLRYTFSDDPAGIENCEPIEKIDQRIEELLHSST
jgi:thiol-disulfide isomerase/thioredoxin